MAQPTSANEPESVEAALPAGEEVAEPEPEVAVPVSAAVSDATAVSVSVLMALRVGDTRVVLRLSVVEAVPETGAVPRVIEAVPLALERTDATAEESEARDDDAEAEAEADLDAETDAEDELDSAAPPPKIVNWLEKFSAPPWTS